MSKLNKRQIVILAIMVIAILFAVYDFFIGQPASKKAKTEAKPVEVESFVNTVTNDIVKEKITGIDTYIIKKAEMEWNKNPFWTKSEYREFAGKEAGGGIEAKIMYSGYVDTGRKRMAIINGFEYTPGDALELEGYVLKSVTPAQILIVNRETGSELIIPIQE